MSMLAWAAVFAASALTAPLEEIYNDSPVVTNVTFEGLATTAQVRTEVAAATNAATRAATGYTDAATNATAAALRGEIGDATNGLLRAESDPAFAAWKKANSVAAGQSASAAQLATAVGPHAKATELSSAAFGYNARANGVRSLALGYGARTTNEQSVAIGYGAVSHGINTFSVNAESPSAFYLGDSSLQSFLDVYMTNGVTSVNGQSGDVTLGAADVGAYTKAQSDAAIAAATNGLASVSSVVSDLAEKADKSSISATDETFSNAVLAVGLNIDTNSVAVLNEIAASFGGFPITGTATTIGGLLAALAAAVAWLKKNKVQTLKLGDGSVETSADGGVAKLDDFFTESNSLLNARITYERNATGLKDRAFNALTFDGTEYNLSTALASVAPTASGQPRDLLIVATATAATTISFTAGTIKGDKPTIDGAGTWIITLTEYAANTWYCRQIKMEDAA